MGKGRGHVPTRTCIVCREKRSKGELIRLRRVETSCVVRDDSPFGPGRGAYVCFRGSCLEKLNGGRLRRAFRCEVPLFFRTDA